VLRGDVGSDPNAANLYGFLDGMASPDRAEYFVSGGPSGGPFRRCTVKDGDNVSGERCEYGRNNRCAGLASSTNHYGTFFLYGAGTRRITEYDLRLPTSFPINTTTWQVITQFKQTGASSGSGGTPVLALEARRGRLEISHYGTASGAPIWGAPITLGQWTHIRWDVTYSVNPAIGKVQLTAGNSTSPVIPMDTLKPEIPPGVIDTRPDCPPINPGEPIPSHFRIGIYHDSALPGTHVDFANVTNGEVE
jgi:hypothetical protein